MSESIILIPAYQPNAALVEVVSGLAQRSQTAIVVVDDGSSPDCQEHFLKISAFPQVQIVRHAVNLGKGAALKTGLNHALVHFPSCRGVVTADADGQHHPEDILKVAEMLQQNPDKLVMGVRAFGGSVPLRSKLGNGATRVLMRLVAGQKLTDTQTGLRGIPVKLIPPLLRLPSSGYEFELDMLMISKQTSCPILEQPIRTIYLEGNKSSHFRPLLDSMRIYFLLFRFSLLSLLTAVLDNAIFILALSATGSIGRAQIAARSVAMVFNYLGARRLVFHSQQRHATVIPKYVAVVIGNGLLSYVLIQFFRSRLEITAVPAKIIAEALLFLVNFVIQRDFVFTRRAPRPAATDWDSYYTSVPVTAKLSRKYTTAVLLDAIRRFAAKGQDPQIDIVEFGGANSCFLDAILRSVSCRSYDVVDTNRYGLSLLAKRAANNGKVHLHSQSVLDLSLDTKADLVFSVGLVEHFEPAGTRAVILSHFQALRPGGTVIITFPTPTILYDVTRWILETVGLWKFHDERPLKREEVVNAIQERGQILYEKTLWPLMLTQHMIVARSNIEPSLLAP